MTLVEAPSLDAPAWLTYRGGDVRGYDRRLEREVYGPHPFARPTDLCVTNGLIRYWVGNAGLAPFLNVQALDDSGTWQHSGVLAFAPQTSPNVLQSARLSRVTPDVTTAILTARNLGDIAVTLQRGERMLRIQHGSSRFPITTGRYVRWLGTPPALSISDTTDTGKFNAGHRQDAGDDVSRFLLPPGLTEFTLPYWWLPDDDSATLDSAGLGSIWDSDDNLVLHTRFDGADNKIKLTVGAVTLSSSALTFSADQPVFVAVRVSATDGLSLTVKTPAAAIEHVSDTTPVSEDFYYLAFLTNGPGTWGEGTWGEGTWGGFVSASGVIDNPMVIDDWLSTTRLASLASASSALDGIAGIEGSVIWYAPFDIRPVIPPASVSSGRMVEASAGLDGLKRYVFGLSTVVGSEFGLGKSGSSVDFAAGVLSSETAASLHAQFASSHSQEVRVR